MAEARTERTSGWQKLGLVVFYAYGAVAWLVGGVVVVVGVVWLVTSGTDGSECIGGPQGGCEPP